MNQTNQFQDRLAFWLIGQLAHWSPSKMAHWLIGVTMSEVTDFRRAKDNYFKTGPGSPLTPEQKQEFKGLNYFPENIALRFELPLEKYPNPEKITMQTSTGSAQDYYKVGQIHFQVNGQDATLQV